MIQRRQRLLVSGLVLAAFWPAISTGEGIKVALPLIGTGTTTLEPVSAQTLTLVVDFAVVVPIEGDIGSIVLGNAAIADAIVADGRMIVLTGKTVGMTNLIVMDADDRILAEFTLQVSGRKPGTVDVRRALELQSYACSNGLCTGSPQPTVDVPPEVTVPSP